MSRKRAKPKGKKLNPIYFIFCEGKTEEAYSKFLRQEYNLPIEILPKIQGQDISEKKIKNFFKKKQNP